MGAYIRSIGIIVVRVRNIGSNIGRKNRMGSLFVFERLTVQLAEFFGVSVFRDLPSFENRGIV